MKYGSAVLFTCYTASVYLLLDKLHQKFDSVIVATRGGCDIKIEII